MGIEDLGIGDRIRAIRIGRGLTQKQLGELCGMADSAIRRYESGRGNPTEKTLIRIADALNTNIQDLLPGNAILQKNTGKLEVGDSYFDGNMTVKDIDTIGDGELRISFELNEMGMSADEIARVLSMFKRLSEEYGVSISGLAQLTEAAAKTISEMQKAQPIQDHNFSDNKENKAAPGATNTESGKDDTDH